MTAFSDQKAKGVIARLVVAGPRLALSGIRRFPRSAALAFGFMLSVLLVVCSEWLCAHLENRRAEAGKEAPDFFGPAQHEPLSKPDVQLGVRPNANASVRAWMDGRDGAIYDVTYTFDEHHRRVTPLGGSGDRDQFILFFGGSFTFGEAVEDDETVPYYVGENAPRYVPYNYGYRGYGPQQMLIQLQDLDPTEDVRQTEGLAVYVFIDAHVLRAIGSMRVTCSYGGDYPYFRVHEGELLRDGTFTSARPVRTAVYELLSRSHTFSYLGLDWPLWISDRHLRLTARIIAESARAFGEKYPGGRFVTVIYPYRTELYGGKIIQTLDEAGVHVLDYRDLIGDPPPEGWPAYRLVEGHPTPLCHRLVAERLVADLSLAAP